MGSNSQTQLLSRAAAVQFLTTGIAPPNAIYFSPDDQLFLFVVPSVVCTLRIVARLLLPTGELKIMEYPFTTVATRSPQLQIQNLGEGFLLSINVYCHTTALRRGQVWVKFVFIRGGLNTQILGQTVAQGYVTELTSLFYPGGPTGYELEGRGNLRSITGTTPAAGAQLLETVPTGAIWRISSFRYNLATSAVVANRTPGLIIDDGVNSFLRVYVPSAIIASNSSAQCFGAGYISGGLGPNQQWVGIPNDLYLPAGFRIQSDVIAMQGADQINLVQYLVEEWLQL